MSLLHIALFIGFLLVIYLAHEYGYRGGAKDTEDYFMQQVNAELKELEKVIN